MLMPTQTYATAPTLWGLGPPQLHDHFWAARGVNVVRQGDRMPISEDAEQYLLMDGRTLAIFKLGDLVELLSWTQPAVLFLRIRNGRSAGYRELAQTDKLQQFVRFQRFYGGSDSRLSRVALTRDRTIALEWQSSADARHAWRLLRKRVRRQRRETMTIQGRVYDASAEQDMADYTRDLIRYWKQPASTISGIRKLRGGVWAYDNARLDPKARTIGPVWIGAGRSIDGPSTVLGPAAIWDDPAARPDVADVPWQTIEPAESFTRAAQPRQASSLFHTTKRIFDIAFSLLVLAVTLPLYPLVMLAIYLEDGRPFFFTHARETLGGRRFPCLKFRSMRKDADHIKAQLKTENQADGPQFYIESDPRLTWVGRVIRTLNIDELPQFFNVLLGQMSVIGPRPSPQAENQFCPAWREARLSIRPGITGLWQIMRTRQRGQDFQEWIKYDLKYVETASWSLDLWIIWKTILLLLKGVLGSCRFARKQRND